MQLFTKYIILVLSCLSISCTSTNFSNNSKSIYQYDKNSKNSLIIGSITTTINGEHPATNMTGHPEFYVVSDLYSENETNRKKIDTISSARPVNIPATLIATTIALINLNVAVIHYKSQFSDQHGQIFVLELLPDAYAFKNWELKSRSPNHEVIMDKDNIKLTSLRFDSRSGEITYIGNINLNIKKWNKDKNNNYTVYDADISQNDKSDRDIPLFLNNFKNINISDIKKRTNR